jgi:hypothetical protein
MASETFDVAEILRATGRALVSEEGFAPDEVDGQIAESSSVAAGPRLSE